VTIFCGLTGQWIFFWIGGVLLAVMCVVTLLWAATPSTPTAEEIAETSGEADTPD